ncbi:hypothetical protein ASE00_09315 [Sphingomonas sp. Root710]|uniref:hypothetical protein n=1 Tax=Sphingomonas sp. Root710 TaxID=1736594 RepID=UPI0006FD2932|nr:hypothetical protein [Sphingomonas sp. Root710]KRB82275.1 hypothetical protein ASE00_09315 [Sphingomonas sp. Root710]
MTADDSPPWWQRPALLAAVVLLGIVPLLWPPLPPLTDLPGHVARWHIATADAASPLHRFYAIRWALIGNLGTDLLAMALVPLFGPIGAGKAIMLLILLLGGAAMLWLAREAHGRVPPTALFALPFLYGWPFQMGFANFVLAQALAFAALALWLRLGRGERLALRAALFAPIGLILWTAHSAGWGLFGLVAFGAELARLRQTGRRWPAAIGGAVLACLPLALPVLIMIANAPPPGARAGETGDWFNILAKFLWVISSLRDRWAWFDTGSLMALLLVLYIGARDRRLGYAPLIGLPALFALGGFLLLPRLLLGGSYVDMRMMPAVWMLALLAIRPPADHRFGQALAIAGLLFFAVRTASTTLSFVLRTAEQRAELGAVEAMPHGATVLALVYKPCLTPWSDIRPEHLPAYATIGRDAFTNEQWAIDGQQYLHIRHFAARPFEADPSQLVYPIGCKEQGRSLADAIATFPRAAFSHVWIIGNRLPPAGPGSRRSGLVPVWTNGRSELYEVIGRVSPQG